MPKVIELVEVVTGFRPGNLTLDLELLNGLSYRSSVECVSCEKSALTPSPPCQHCVTWGKSPTTWDFTLPHGKAYRNCNGDWVFSNEHVVVLVM